MNWNIIWKHFLFFFKSLSADGYSQDTRRCFVETIIYLFICVYVCERGESLVCDQVAALLFDILSLYYIQTVLSCFCASQFYIFVLYCKFPIINKMSSEGIYTFVCTQVYLFSGMLISLSFLIRPGSEDGKSRTIGEEKQSD